MKICGITNIEDAMFAVSLGADYLGVILDESVARHGTQPLLADINGLGAETVGVYTSMKQIESSALNENIIQIHFPHEEDDVRKVKELSGKKVISVIQFSTADLVADQALKLLHSGSDFILVEKRDGIAKVSTEIPSITGKARVGIAGKISPDNISGLLHYGVEFIDVSSSVEKSPGKKDHQKLAALFRNAGRVS